MKPNLIFVLFFATICLQTESKEAIDYLELKNAEKETVFIVLNERSIKVPNRHRKPSQPSFKLFLTGAKIESVDTKSSLAWTLHLSDKTTVDFTVEEKSNATDFFFLWHGGGPNEHREVCFQYAHNEASWYSTYQSIDQKWPMDTKKKVTKSNFNHLSEYDFFNEPAEFYNILELLFMNSDGFSLVLNPEQPWFIRRDPNEDDPLLCFSVNNSFPYAQSNTEPTYKNIDFRLTSSTNIRSVVDYVHKTILPKPSTIPDERKFTFPSVFISGNRESIVKSVHEMINQGFKNFDVIFVGWEKALGDLTFDSSVQPNVDVMVSELAKLGIGISPELRSNVNNYAHEATQQYVLKDATTNQLVNFLDFTNPKACDWFETMLKNIYYEENINQFHLYKPAFSNMKMYNQIQPNVYVQNFISTVQRFAKVSSYSAFRTQNLPVVVVPIYHSKADNTQILRMLIPNALSTSLAGYSYFSSYLIGIFAPEKNREEIYIRWVQAASLLPCLTFHYFPMGFSPKAIELTKKFIDLHIEHATTIIDLAKKRAKDGTPIIRPMWYAEPDNSKTYKIDDQYMLGSDIVVAPVVVVGQRERSVYLPPGDWLDQHGKNYKGPGEFTVITPLEDLPFFKRKSI